MSIISVSSLTKSYKIAEKSPGFKGTLQHFISRRERNVLAVDNLDFEIEEGEVVGFIGSNGAGKTTTLKMLCGLIHPTNGRVNVAGFNPIRRQRSFLCKITLVMGQKQQLIWDLPPLDSLKVNAAVYGLSSREANKRIDELASMLDLDCELSRPVRKLSLGQRMKAELLAALLHRPSVLFLDEPTLGLDINAQIKVRKFLSKYNQKYGATILLTSHYMGDINSLCKRVLLIHQGRIFHDGSLLALTQRLSPCKSVKIALTSPIDIDLIKPLGEVIDFQSNSIQLLIQKENLANQLSVILKCLPVKDLEVKDPPIEELIGRLIHTGTVEE